MDKLNRGRRPVRKQLTRTNNDIIELLAKANPDPKELRVNLDLLMKTMSELEAWDNRVKEQLIEDEAAEETVDDEYQVIERYNRAYLASKQDLEEKLGTNDLSTISDAGITGEGKKRKFHLPEVKLRTFGGCLKDWLGWWSQFRKIDEDEELHDTDKFHYLCQAMETGTEAKELVMSYPQTEGNYAKAVESLKERYGRQDLLLQVYVRELLSLVITNVTSKDKLTLSQLYLRLESHLRSLAELNLDKADPATWLYPLVESSLSEETLRAWQRSALSKADNNVLAVPKSRLEKLMEFIKVEVQSEQQILLAQQGFQTTSVVQQQKSATHRRRSPRFSKVKHYEDVSTAAGLVSLQSSSGCGFCEKNHDTDKCFKAQRMTMEERNKIVDEKKLCFQCLFSGHPRWKCKAAVRCAVCSGKHHPIMCMRLNKQQSSGNISKEPSMPPAKRQRVDENSEASVNVGATTSFHQGSNQCSRNVLLNTLKVQLLNSHGNKQTVRLLCDSASQRSYLLTRLVNKIQCHCVDSEWIQNILFGGKMTAPKKYRRHAVKLVGFNAVAMEVELLEREKISGDICEIPNGPWLEECQHQGIAFTDVGDGTSEAEIVIGMDYWGAIRTGRVIKLSGGLCAEETIFGWVLGGPIEVKSSTSMISSCQTVSSQDIEKLWSLEAIGIRDPVETKTAKEEEQEALTHFSKSIARDNEGRFIVSLPWRSEERKLPSNRNIAEQRLKITTFKLKRDNKLPLYHGVFQGWEKEGLIIRMKDDGLGHFIPHRPVFKYSTTTPVRPVFDASCKQGRSPSLNDCLHKGPNLIERIPSLMLRFGDKKIGVSADIRKAFQMIKVKEEDQLFQRFLWWEDESCTKPVIYQHQRVVFGITSSPFLLGATINHHLKTSENRQMGSKLENSFYVDNLVSSVNSFDECKEFREAATNVMAEAKMELRQWASTMSSTAADNDVSSYTEKILPVLGVLWNRETDSLSCVIKEYDFDQKVTKRNMLSVVAQIFDPMGILCPAVLLPKMLVQEQWATKMGWDTPVPDEARKIFLKWVKGVDYLKNIAVPRYAQQFNATVREVHVFSDSSSDAMAAVAFLRTECYGGTSVQFLVAKSRLTPTKKPTIPRAELIGCLLGARIGCMVTDALDISQISFHYWSDSSTALAWIERAGDWGVFVTNRVNEILLSTTVDQWNHVPGKMNPADLPSRGCAPLLLAKSKWWEGPAWLCGPKSAFPSSSPVVNEEEILPEMKKITVMMNLPVAAEPRFSSYRKNVAVWGWILRFVNGLKGMRSNTMFLTIGELRAAEKVVLKQVQMDSFLSNCNEVGGIEVIRDSDELMRVKTRLANRNDKADFIYPILLPKSHPLVETLVNDVHTYHGHGGIQFLMSKIREKYWIVQSRRVVRKVVHGCVKCQRHAVKNMEVEPAALPAKRVSDSEVFATTGVDLAGPLVLKDSQKAWIVLYTCAVYRAVYLDVVTSLSTEAFLGSLERFVSHHGRPNTMYSDNGTNFVGASNLFRQVNWTEVEQRCSIKQIQWIFNPPTAAWWGGWWERMVRMVKDLLKRMLGKSKLNYDELRTCLAGVTATINDRPLTLVTEDNMDLVPLTPAMFLRPRESGHVPELGTAEQLRKSYRRMKELQSQLQARFRKEYLSLLISRSGKKTQFAIMEGDVVLVGADNRKRFQWPLGLVTKLLPGKDGKTRVVKVKTANGIFTRPVQRLYPLEVSQRKPVVCLKEKAGVLPERVEQVAVTRSGRVVKNPIRYGQWMYLIKHV